LGNVRMMSLDVVEEDNETVLFKTYEKNVGRNLVAVDKSKLS
jgi:hypothetical protein